MPRPMTNPPAANAPIMPPTRPRTTGVVAMKSQPSTTWRHSDGRAAAAVAVGDRAVHGRAAGGLRQRQAGDDDRRDEERRAR